jgi:transposase
VAIMVGSEPGAAVVVRRIVVDAAGVTLEAVGGADRARCPACGTLSDRVHDRHRRRPLELPWRGHVVRLTLMVRRFRCGAPGCPRRTFTEDVGTALPPRARRTAEVDAHLLRFARAAGAEAGARLATSAGLPVSADTLLRLERRNAAPTAATPRVLGVDDLALRRGINYATILVDLETRRPVDLVAGREAAVLGEWLCAHPGTEVVVRDRAEAYAEGARTAAPAARQVADRFHLVQNASAALDGLLRDRRRRIEILAEPDPATARPPSATGRHRAERRAARVARWETVQALRRDGRSISGIARELAMDRRTVRTLLRTTAPPRNRVLHPRPPPLSSPTLAPYVAHLQDRWQAGCHNVCQLHREIVALGYTGSRTLLSTAVQPWRPPRTPRGKRRRLSLRWLCLRPPAGLDPYETAARDAVLTGDQDLATGYGLLQRFRALIARRDPTRLDAWLADAAESALAPFVTLAAGIRADRAAVDAALTTAWSNGPVEGHVHRVKLLKRRGYGRAKLDLLRARVLAA